MAHVSLIRNAFSLVGRHIRLHGSGSSSSMQCMTNLSHTRRLQVFLNLVRFNSDGYNPQPLSQISHEAQILEKRKEKRDFDALQTIEEELPESPDREYMLPSQRRKEHQDILLKKLTSCDSAHDVLEIYKKHSDVMDDRHLMKTFQTLNILVAKGYEESSYLHNNEAFQDLCQRAFKGSRRMDVTDLVNLLQYLCRLEVSSKSKLVQTVLQLLRHSLNDLDARLLIRLNFLLKKLPLTPLSHGMLMAMAPILENILNQEPLDNLSLKQLSYILSMGVVGRVRNVGLVLQEIYKRGNIHSGNMAMNIIWSLLEVYSQDNNRVFLSKDEQLTREVLLKVCLGVLSRNLDMFKTRQIETTLSKICRAYENQDVYSYNEHFLSAMVMNLMERNTGFVQVSHVIKRLLKLNFLSEEFVDYVVSSILQNPEELVDTPCPVSSLLTAIAASPNFGDNHLNAIKVILKHPSLSSDTDNCLKIPLLNITLDLLSVDYFPEPYLELLTSKEFLSQYMGRYSKGYVTSKQLLQLNQVLTVSDKSTYSVPDEFLTDVRILKKDLEPSQSILAGKLHQILGEADLFLSGVISENGIYFDHLIVVDDEGRPIRISEGLHSEEMTDVGSLNIPQNAKRIAVMDVKSSEVYGPRNILKRYIRLDQQLLEASGYLVTPVLQSVISRLTVDERPLYIKNLLEKSGVVF